MRANTLLTLSFAAAAAASPSWWSNTGLSAGFREEANAGAEVRRRQVTASASCAKGVHIIGVSGAGAPNNGNYGYLVTLVSNISAIIPQSTNITLPYDKGSQDFITSTTAGTQTLIQYIQDYYKSCPTTKQVLVGYSSGAIIMMNALCGASSDGWAPTNPFPANWTKPIVAAVAYGDETYRANQTYDTGPCKLDSNSAPRRKPENCAAWASTLHSYCDIGDPRCCSGLYPPAHFGYPNNYDVIASSWVKQRFRNSTAVRRAAAKARKSKNANTEEPAE